MSWRKPPTLLGENGSNGSTPSASPLPYVPYSWLELRRSADGGLAWDCPSLSTFLAVPGRCYWTGWHPKVWISCGCQFFVELVRMEGSAKDLRYLKYIHKREPAKERTPPAFSWQIFAVLKIILLSGFMIYRKFCPDSLFKPPMKTFWLTPKAVVASQQALHASHQGPTVANAGSIH